MDKVLSVLRKILVIALYTIVVIIIGGIIVGLTRWLIKTIRGD